MSNLSSTDYFALLGTSQLDLIAFFSFVITVVGIIRIIPLLIVLKYSKKSIRKVF